VGHAGDFSDRQQMSAVARASYISRESPEAFGARRQLAAISFEKNLRTSSSRGRGSSPVRSAMYFLR
jgi:hypothetical protein